MFTGIVSAVTNVGDISRTKDGMILKVVTPKKWRLKNGASILVSGVCSTIKKVTPRTITFEYMPESVERTHLADLQVGSKVNLEQSLRATDRLDGHIMQGHVDTVGKIEKIMAEGNSKVITIRPRDQKLMRYITEKGTVAIEGISLTITRVDKKDFTVKIIPYTWTHTNLSEKKVGNFVNLECDVLAKYLDRLILYANKK